MGIIDTLSRIWRRDAVHYVVAHIPPARQDNPIAQTTITAEQHYFRLWLSEMFLKDDGRLFRNYVPAVHSTVRLQFGGRPAQELPYLAGPQNLGLGNTLGKGVQLNHPLSNLLPFRGGTVSIGAALAAYKERDFLESFMGVLSDVSGLLNVGQLSTTLKVVDAAVDGIQDLLGGRDKDIHIMYFGGFGGLDLEGGVSLASGYSAVIRANAQSFDENSLWVKGNRLCFGSDLDSAKPLDGYDYFLLRLEASTRRDDFMSFESYARLLQEAIKEGARDRAVGDELIKTIKVLVWDSPDLTNTDRIAVAAAIQAQYREALGDVVTVKTSPTGVPSLHAASERGASKFSPSIATLTQAIQAEQHSAEAKAHGLGSNRIELRDLISQTE